MSCRVHLAASLAMAAAAASCAEPEPTMPTVEPGEVVVQPVVGARLCEGTAAWAQDEIARVEQEIGLPPAFELPVTVGASGVAEDCTDPSDPEAVLGCTVGEGAGTTVITTPQALSHELVHALRRHYDLRTQPLFEEGFAERINGSDAYPRFLALTPDELPDAGQPEALVELPYALFRDAQSYRTATHWLDFVAEQQGAADVAAFMRGGIDRSGDEAQARFEAHFGASLTERAQAWRDAGRRGSGRGDPCAASGVMPLPVDGIVRATVDCDAAGTMGLSGAGETAWVRQCITLPAGRYDVMVSAMTGGVRWDPVPDSCADDSSAVGLASKQLTAGESLSLELAACTWAVAFESTLDGSESFTLTVNPV